MGIFNVLDPVLDAGLGWLAELPPAWGMMIISALIALIIVIVYKYTTDQEKMKEWRDKQKKLQAKAKAAQKKQKMDEMQKLNQEMMQVSGKMMKHSFKPTFYTIIPIIILFGWLSGTFGYYAVSPGQSFNVSADFAKGYEEALLAAPEGLEIVSPVEMDVSDREASWELKANQEGEYLVDVEVGSNIYSKRVVVSEGRAYVNTIKRPRGLFDFIYGSREGYLPSNAAVNQIEVGYESIRPFGSFSIFGWRPGWLGTYIIFSIIFSILFRKLMKVY